MELINLFDFEEAARDRLDPMAFDYYAAGAHDEITVCDNHAAYDRLRLRYRVLRGVGERDLSTTLLGGRLQMPVLAAPTAFQRMAHPDGELATARACGVAGTAMILSTLSTTRLEDVTAAATGPVWFQLYVYRDRTATSDLVHRARDAGCQAIVLTVDAPLLGTRERDIRNRFHLPEGLALENLTAEGMRGVPVEPGGSGLAAYVASLLDPSLDWETVAWLRSLSDLPVLVKGIVHPDDARLAVEHGASGVVVSNHGGRQLDTASATIEALPDVAQVVDGRVPVLVDGGIRRGTDVVKALALGANAVAVGRPILWGLAAGGEAGAAKVLRILRDELDLALALCGCTTPDELSRDLVVGGPGSGL
jgi:4-hydroxymandelate oxidase